MTILIDGHNLIGSGVFDDIRLSDEDDEARLVARLRVWRSRLRRKFVVFFDRGIAGGRDHRMSGAGVDVVFAANPTEADDLIRRRLRSASRHNTILVSNDDALAQVASAHGIERWRGHEFIARMAIRVADVPIPEAGEEWDVRLNKQEVEEWLEVFRAARRAKRAQRKQVAGDGRGDPTTAKPALKPAAKPAAGVKRTRPVRISGDAAAGGGSTPGGAASSEKREKTQRKPPKQSQRKARQAARTRKSRGATSGSHLRSDGRG